MNYRRKKNDQNQKDIVAQLQKIPGVGVQIDHDDILVGYRGRTYWFEIKNPNEITKSGTLAHKSRLTEQKQEALALLWPGHYRIVWKIEQILEDLGIE